MRAKLLGSAGCVLGLAAAAAAQFPNNPYTQPGGGAGVPQNPGNFMPNIYNPQTQPLSPYLNMLRGSNPAANYYYGVRPGTVGGAGNAGTAGAANFAGGGNRGAFFPQLATGPDPFNLPDPETGAGANVLPPAGHPVVFGNTLGYFPGSAGRGMRPGLGGVGNNRPATPRK